jgi:hypothetical protein
MTSSSPTSVISPSYPADRSAWAVRTPPTEAPTMTVDLVILSVPPSSGWPGHRTVSSSVIYRSRLALLVILLVFLPVFL